MLAVSTNDNGIKILANADGIRLLKTVERQSLDAASRISSTAIVKVNANLKVCLVNANHVLCVSLPFKIYIYTLLHAI